MKQLTCSRAHAFIAGALFLFLILADRLTKLAALSFLGSASDLPRDVLVTHAVNFFGVAYGPCLSFELVLNRGVSWGLFASDSALGFVLMGLLILGVTAVIACGAFARWRAGTSFWAELLIVAGSAGNILDRVWYGGVIDFIKLSWGSHSWPVFNVADCCIVLGVGLLFLRILKK